MNAFLNPSIQCGCNEAPSLGISIRLRIADDTMIPTVFRSSPGIHSNPRTLLYPTNQLKSKINKLIPANNAELNSSKLPKITGDYKPGYLYRTVKIHKPNHLLRPIISQIPTPIYEFTKTIEQLIPPYLPSKYNIKSTHELIQVLHTIKPNNGILASLYVENLFTNIPVNWYYHKWYL